MVSESTPLVGSGSHDGPSRDLGLARNAYEANDVELSKKAHNAAAAATEEGHNSSGDMIKAVVFGGMDGILTTFAIVSGANGGGLGTLVILVLGFSSKIADALAMGLGSALSTKAEHEHIRMEREREYWEYDNYPEGEIQEMIDMYENRGMSRSDADKVIRLMADHRDFFVDVMMVEELGLQAPEDDASPWFEGFVTFCSFIFFGFFPLMVYCIFPFAFPGMTDHQLFVLAGVVSGLTLFVLGTVKSQFSVKPWWKSGLEMLVIGMTLCAIAYSIGSLTKTLFGVDPGQI